MTTAEYFIEKLQDLYKEIDSTINDLYRDIDDFQSRSRDEYLEDDEEDYLNGLKEALDLLRDARDCVSYSQNDFEEAQEALDKWGK